MNKYLKPKKTMPGFNQGNLYEVISIQGNEVEVKNKFKEIVKVDLKDFDLINDIFDIEDSKLTMKTYTVTYEMADDILNKAKIIYDK